MNELRPTKLSEIIGQDKIKEVLQICIDASNKQNKALPHILFEGPPGLGKSTFGYVLAAEIGAHCTHINAATISDQSSLIKALSQAKHKDLIFIDEIHALPQKYAELLYMPLEDRKLIIEATNKYSKEKHIVNIPLQEFTLIGATTHIGKMPKPLLDRMQRRFSIDFYSLEDVQKIILDNAKKSELNISKECAVNISARCKGIPRVANAYLGWIKDYCVAKNINSISASEINKAFELYGVQPNGLDKNDLAYLDALEKSNVPLGLKAISSISGLTESAIEEHIEPFLLRTDIIRKTKTGRILTKKLVSVEALLTNFMPMEQNKGN